MDLRAALIGLAIVSAACGDTARPAPTTVAPTPTYTAVVTDAARAGDDARIATALQEMASFGAAVGRIEGPNLKALAPRLRRAERRFSTALAAIATAPAPTDPALAAARTDLVASWTRLHRAMASIAGAAAGNDAKAFLAADERFIRAATAAQRAGDAFARAAG